jgi:excisionase family DNA binding protein
MTNRTGKVRTMAKATRSDAQHKLIGIPEAAKLLNVDDHTIRRLIAKGRLPAFRVGTKLIRLRRKDVEALLRPVLPGTYT